MNGKEAYSESTEERSSLNGLRSKSNLPTVYSASTNDQDEPQDANEEHEPLVPGAWVHLPQAVVPMLEPLDGPQTKTAAKRIPWKELGNAIRKGDSMPADKSMYKAAGKAKRRALLIGGQYETDTRFEVLPGTPRDIWNVYCMLRNRGYEKENIRILLARAVDTTQYKCQPTKKNIMKSLEWLVQDAENGDYRYFHFSGHGEIFESPSGKLARRIPTGTEDTNEDDTELHGNSIKRIRVASQTIDVSELKSYSEAISAYCRDMPPHATPDLDQVDWQNNYRIRDEELNRIFARLPEGCTLTCTIDCCHAGRIANNNFKLKGAGFRGSMLCDGNADPGQLMSHIYQPHNALGRRARAEHELTGGAILRSGTNGEPSCPVKISVPLQSSLHGSTGLGEVHYVETVSPTSRGPLSFATNVYRYFCPPNFVTAAVEQGGSSSTTDKIRVEEQLPIEEARQDKIKANMFTWGSCHQRQKALEGAEGGYFTSAFVTVVKEVQGAPTVGELFDSVNAKVEEMLSTNIKKSSDSEEDKSNGAENGPEKTGVNPQYIQLWTSLGEGTEDSACSKLNDIFKI